MASLNKIRLYPIDQSQICLVTDNEIELEPEPVLPSGFVFPAGVVPIGGHDVKANLGDLNQPGRG